MSLRDDIVRTIQQARDEDLADVLTAGRILGLPDIAAIDRMSAGTLLMPEPMTIQFGAPSGIDQGITRLAFLAFVRGLNGMWNGERRVVGHNHTAWVRYRGHHVDRESTPDGIVIRVTHRDHIGATQTATYPVQSRVEDPVASQWVTDLIDGLIDAVIEHHGVPGDEVPDAEIVDLIDGPTARRVLSSWHRWLRDLDTGDRVYPAEQGHPIDAFAAAIERGEVTP